MKTIWSFPGLLAISMLTGLATTPAFCQEAGTPDAAPAVKTWTVDECLSRAMDNNPAIRSAREGLKVASGANLMTLSEFVPRLSWSTVYMKNNQAALGSLGSSIANLSPSMYSDEYYVSTLSADLTLFSWRLKPLRGTMRSNSRLARLQLAQAQNDLTLNVKRSFYTTIYAKQLLVIAKAAEDVAVDNLTTTENLYKVGRASSFDVTRARVRRVNAKTAVISARNYETVSFEGLRQVLSLPAEELLDVKGEFPQAPQDASLEDEIKAALQRRPELNGAKESENLAASARESARAGFLPTVFLGYSRSWTGLNLSTEGNYNAWTARAGISIPLFDGLNSIGNLKARKANLQQARERVQQTSDGVVMEVRQSYYSLANAKESLLAQKENVETAAENLRIAQERYKMGLLSQLELKDAELSLTDARTQETKALYDLTISRANLDRAAGRPSDNY